jgi:hypothetical protein
MGVKRSARCASRAAKSARASGALPRRCFVPDSRDQQARLDRRRGLARLFSHAQYAHRRAVRKGADRSQRLRRAVVAARLDLKVNRNTADSRIRRRV